MTRKKLIFLVPNLDGGGGRVISELSLKLPETIQKIIVSFENKIKYPFQGKLIILGTPLSKNFLFKSFIFWRGILKFRKIVIRENPDWTISLGNLQNIINILVGKNPIVRVDNYISEGNKKFSGRIYLILAKILFNRAKKVIVVSKAIREDLIKRFNVKKEKIQVIYNPIDIEKIERLSKEEIEPEYKRTFEYPVIINIGALIDQKGQWHLIRAFSEAKKINKDLKLIILGEGELESFLSKLIKGFDLENDVYLLGWQENPFKFLARSKLFVLSSLWEGLGIVILEALACGVPVISSDCMAGPREILAPDTNINFQTEDIEYAKHGVLIAPFDRRFYKVGDPLTREEKMLSKTILELITNEELVNELNKNARKRAMDFEIRSIIKEYNFLD